MAPFGHVVTVTLPEAINLLIREDLALVTAPRSFFILVRLPKNGCRSVS